MAPGSTGTQAPRTLGRGACAGWPAAPPRGRSAVAPRWALAVALLAACSPGHAQNLPVTDESVGAAIARAVAWVQAQRKPGGHWEPVDDPTGRYWGGSSALALLALLYAGEDPRHSDMAESLDWLAGQELHATYCYALRAHALALVPGTRYRRRLEADVEWLLRAARPRGAEHPGAYTYTADHAGGAYDNSNSQFGVLGVWMAAEAGVSAAGSKSFWKLVEDHWTLQQNVDGGWPYMARGPSTGSMTAAGLATLYVVLDHGYAREEHRRALRLIRNIELGLDWLSREFSTDNPHGSAGWKYYYLYGLERAGRASGRKYFGRRDWFRLGAGDLLASQRGDGSWPGTGMASDLHNTCFALMFLCHGRAPLLFNKLDHGSDWDEHLRDVPGLLRYAQPVLERLLNWQIVTLDGPLEDLLEAPVLYMNGAAPRVFSDVEAQKLREYCLRGGMILAVDSSGGDAFVHSLRILGRRIFPEHPLRPLPADHPLFNGQVQYVIDPAPLMLEIHNGQRTLLLATTHDLADSWDRYAVRSRERDLRLGCNIYLYATDKSGFRSRLTTPVIPLQPTAVRRTIRVARIQYSGNWNIEPYGWTRLAAEMHNQTGSRLLVTSGVTLGSPELAEFRIAHLSGDGAFRLEPAERAGLRRFLTAGGTLLADAAGGSPAFLASLEEQLDEVLGVRPEPVPLDHPLLTGRGLEDGMDLRGVACRRAVRGQVLPGGYPALRMYAVGRRAAVVYCPLDLSVGLLGTPVFGCRGYEPGSALRIMRNLLLYAHLSTADKTRLQGDASADTEDVPRGTRP